MAVTRGGADPDGGGTGDPLCWWHQLVELLPRVVRAL